MVTCWVTYHSEESCLGLLMFVLYLNAFESCLKFSKGNPYADDTEVSFASSELSDVTRNFQAELKKFLSE